MEWLQDNGVKILAILGGLYAVARVVVAMTPTPRDDAALEKVGAVLTTLNKLFGLDLKQGREQKPKP